MKLEPQIVVVLALLFVASGAARAGESAQEDKDLSLIPPPPPTPPVATPVTSGASQKIFLEDAGTQSWLEDRLVPAPPPPDARWEERALFDVRKEWHVGDGLRLTYSGRVNLRTADGLGFPNHENLTNDLREAYLSWQPLDRLFFDVGRINVRSGVALGFNPTDFFKTRAVVEPLSVDPVVLREDRLGTLAFGRATGSLPAAAASVLPGLGSVGFRNQVAVGASYTTALPKIPFNFEFHYNQAGFSGADWDEWFRTGSGASAPSPIPGALWYVREYASDQQELISRRYAFLRMDWVDAFVPKLEVTGFIDADLTDGSTRLQLGADYYLSDRWTIGGLVLVDSGGRHSDFGSLPQAGSVLLKVVRYF